MIQIYFNKEQFPKTLEECSVNNEVTKLNQDIKYVPASFNEIFLMCESDSEDWQDVCDNREVFIGYLIDTIQENMTLEEEGIWRDMPCIDLIKKEFIIHQNYPEQKITKESLVYISRTADEIRVVLYLSTEPDVCVSLLSIPQKVASGEDYEKWYGYAMEAAKGISEQYGIKLDIDDVLGFQRSLVSSSDEDYSLFYNKGNDCDACKNQYLRGVDGDAYGCRCKDSCEECHFEEDENSLNEGGELL